MCIRDRYQRRVRDPNPKSTNEQHQHIYIIEDSARPEGLKQLNKAFKLPNSKQKMTKWLVAVDGSEAGERAFQAIVNLGKAGDEVLILTVTDLVYYMLIDPTASASGTFDDLRKKMNDRAEGLLSKYEATIKEKLPEAKYQTLLLQGNPREVIIQTVADHKVDILVIGQVGLSVGKSVSVGSTSDFCIRNAHCNVLLVK
eukprot:TRINITY_DN2770_c0_g1_i1.p1 TRINITY_DN2770_c0_g1~~TRINITY_DN2770_c0_g1_i1.p1  ORF type:complete len:199 (+),score=46.86 TRINITY_DN2770_c0_g1_i1:41-637(+)